MADPPSRAEKGLPALPPELVSAPSDQGLYRGAPYSFQRNRRPLRLQQLGVPFVVTVGPTLAATVVR